MQKLDLPLIFSYDYGKCMFVGFFTEYIGTPNREHSLVELSIELLKEGQNRGFNHSFGKTLYRELISSSCIGAYLKRWVKLLGPPLAISKALREF